MIKVVQGLWAEVGAIEFDLGVTPKFMVLDELQWIICEQSTACYV